MGAGLILFESSFGPRRVQRFINEESYTVIKIGALYVYGIIVSYFFLTGANGILSAIPLGTPGNILSSGGILPIILSSASRSPARCTHSIRCSEGGQSDGNS